jgi:hypothetical protein
MLIGYSLIWEILIQFWKTYLTTENSLLNSSIVQSFSLISDLSFDYSNLCFIGKRSDHKMVNNIQLPDWANSPVDFIHKHRLV